MIIGEAGSRQQIFKLAKERGCLPEIKAVFKKYDQMLKRCDNPLERQAIAAEAILIIHNYFSLNGELIVNGLKIK